MAAAEKHAERAHALLSASGATRWLNCTPSARLEDEKGTKDETSVYAAEGTLAHEFAETILRYWRGDLTGEQLSDIQLPLRENPLFSDEMPEEVEKYTSFVMEEYAALRRTDKGAAVFLEEKIDLTTYIPEGFGTGDAVMVGGNVLHVIDLKYGKGVRVSAKDNAQLKLYGLGSLHWHDLSYDIKTVRLSIVQPRLDSVSTWDIDADELRAWGESEVKAKAEQAHKGEGDKTPGDWCRWCKVKAKCRALAEQNLALAKHDFKSPDLLSDDELLDVYAKIEGLKNWADAVGAHVFEEALKGKKWEGLKLVEGRSVRKWRDEEKVAARLAGMNYSKDAYTKEKLAGIGDIEKLITKKLFEPTLGDLVEKPKGKPTLTTEDDKRPVWSNNAAEDFGEDIPDEPPF